MKTILRKSAIVASLIAVFAAATFNAQAQQNSLVYKLAHNTSIGITVDNATGANYVIKDSKGNIVLKGTVKNDKTFYINTGKLGKGTYRFMIGSLVLQEFVIR